MDLDTVYTRKTDIERKLLEEQNKLSMLKESLAKADTLTNNMVTILDHFDERLHKLEETILPVHRKTKDLQRLQDNIDKTTVAFDHVISYHHIGREVEPVLRQGPSRQVDRYLEYMNKLSKAVQFFSENNPDSPELNSVKQLFDIGKEGLEKEFQGQLSRLTKPVAPEMLFEMKSEPPGKKLSVDYKPSNDQINSLPEKAINDLSKMAKWLADTGKSSGFASKYAHIRSSNLLKTLLGLKDYVRERGSNSNRKHSTVKDTPKKSSNRKTGLRKATTLLRKESLQSFSGMNKGGAYPPIAEEEVLEVETEPFIEIITYAVKLFVVEQDLLTSIIPENNRKSIFDQIIQASMELISQDGNKFVAFAKQCVTRHDHSSVTVMFPAIKHLKEKLPLYLDTLKSASDINRSRIASLITELDSTGSKVLDDFTDSVKSDPEKESNMSKDGTVHELTSNAMLFIQQLAGNLDVSGGMLASQHHQGAQSKGKKSEQCLSQYMSHVLGALKLNLENKSRVYVDQSLAAIFLLNNYNYILTALYRYDLLRLVQFTTPDIESIYQTVIVEQRRKYLQSWDKFAGYLSDDNKQGLSLNAQPGVRLKDKEKQVVKDKFKSFNNELEDITKLHGTWAVPDLDIRNDIRQALRDRIIPLYTDFHNKYRMVQFTKNIEKYLKHTPESVGACLDRLFD